MYFMVPTMILCSVPRYETVVNYVFSEDNCLEYMAFAGQGGRFSIYPEAQGNRSRVSHCAVHFCTLLLPFLML